MGIATVAATVGDTHRTGIGTGSTDASEVVLVRMLVTPNERSAVFTAVLISDADDEIHLHALGRMIPEETWEILGGEAELENGAVASLRLYDQTTVELAVDGPAGARQWRGSLSAAFTRDVA